MSKCMLKGEWLWWGGGTYTYLHLSFSSRVPREVTDSAWMNSENSMRPSCREGQGGDREGVRSSLNHSSYLYQLSPVHVCQGKNKNRARLLAPSGLLFLPCTWPPPPLSLSLPRSLEGGKCHPWSLVRRMPPVHCLKGVAHMTMVFRAGIVHLASTTQPNLPTIVSWIDIAKMAPSNKAKYCSNPSSCFDFALIYIGMRRLPQEATFPINSLKLWPMALWRRGLGAGCDWLNNKMACCECR